MGHNLKLVGKEVEMRSNDRKHYFTDMVDTLNKFKADVVGKSTESLCKQI